MKLPAQVTDPDGYPGVAVRVVPTRLRTRAVNSSSTCAYEVVGPDGLIRVFHEFDVRPSWPRTRSVYDDFLDTP